MTQFIRSEHLLSTIIQESPVPVALYSGSEMMIEMANPAMIKLWDKGETVIGKPLHVALPDFAGQPFLEPLRNVYNTGIPYEASEQKAEVVVNGVKRLLYFDLTYKPLFNEQHQVFAILHTALDVTSKVESRLEAKANHERINFVLESVGIGTWVIDPIAGTMEWDKYLGKIFNMPFEGKVPLIDVIKYIHPDDYARVAEAVSKALTPGSGGNYDMEYRGLDPTGKIRYIQSRGQAYFNEEGIAYRFAGTAADITESVKISEEQLHSKLKASIALQAAGMGFWSVYALEDRVELDTSCQQMYGWPHPEIALTKLLSFIHPDDIEPIKEALQRRAGIEEEVNVTRIIEYRLNRPSDGQMRWIRLNGMATFNEQGVASFFTGTATDITDQKRKDDELRNIESRYQTAFDNAGLGIVMISLDGTFIRVNKAFCTLTGYQDCDLYNLQYTSITHHDDLALSRQEVARLVSGEINSTQLHKRYIRKDGSAIWVNINSTRIHRENNEVIILKIIQDVTSEMLARNEQQKLLSMVENSADFMALSDVNGKVIYINESGRRLVGIPIMEDMSQLSVKDFYTEEQYRDIDQVIAPVIMKTGRWSGQVNFRHFVSGELIPCHASGLRIDDPFTGQPIGRGFTMRDLRPWLDAQAAVYESEMLLRNITAASPTALWMSDEKGHITYVNETWLQWTGQTEDQTLNEGWVSALFDEDRKPTMQVFTTAVQQRSNFHAEFRLNGDGGEVRWCVAKGNPQYNAEGDFTGYIGSCMDVTESKEFEKQKDDFLGMASHELKTPVTSIKAYTQVLESTFRKEGDTRRADMLHKMGNQVNRLTHLIGDLLDVTKINSGRLQFNQTRFDFTDMVKDTVEEVQRTTDKHLIIEEYTPAGCVIADRDRISQVVINLITNAAKYSPKADHIIVGTRSERGRAVLWVQDFGIGIPEDKQQRIFEQFYRVSGNREFTFPGLGLGLYISSEIMRHEGGTIGVKSFEGEGATFTITLPQAL